MVPILGPLPAPNVIVAALMIAALGLAPKLGPDELIRVIEASSEFIVLFVNGLEQERLAAGQESLVLDMDNFPDDLLPN